TVNPSPISLYDGTQFVQIGALDRTAHEFIPVLSSASVIGTAPITVNVSAGVATIGLAIDTKFTVTGGQLALNSIPASNMLANCTGGAAEPGACTWNSFANQAISNTNGTLPYRTGGAWSSVSGTITVNGVSCTLGSSCSPPAGTITVGTSVIS